MDWGGMSREEYVEKFHKPQAGFYVSLGKQLRRLSRGSLVLDVGAGIGKVAELARFETLDMRIKGIEPSSLHEIGMELALELEADENTAVEYDSVNRSLTDYLFKPGGIDLVGFNFQGITFINSAHEVAISSGGKDSFYEQITILSPHLDSGGFLIIGDPMFPDRFMMDPKQYAAQIDKLRGEQEAYWDHSHTAEELFTPAELSRVLDGRGFQCLHTEVHQNIDFLNFMRSRGYQGHDAQHQLFLAVYQKD
ncbi:hypothetical protein ACFL1B_04725 [Nanoarchaeota archaeon]